MGLRSRQRRRDGVTHEETYDVETSQHRKQTLEEHLQASKRDVDVFNFAWKHALGVGGILLTLYEVGLYLQTLTVARHAPPSFVLCLLFKIIAIASILATRKYALTGSSSSFGWNLILTSSHTALWFICSSLLGIRFSIVQVSPVPLVYFAISHLALLFIGGNTRAEIARARQLEKLEQVFNTSSN